MADHIQAGGVLKGIVGGPGIPVSGSRVILLGGLVEQHIGAGGVVDRLGQGVLGAAVGCDHTVHHPHVEGVLGKSVQVILRTVGDDHVTVGVLDVQLTVVVVGHALGEQRVEHQLGHVVTGQALVHSQGQSAVQLHAGSTAGNHGLPVLFELIFLGEVAQGLQQHSSCLDGGDGGAGVELTLAHAHHNAGGRAVVYVALGPGGHVGEFGDSGKVTGVHVGAVQKLADDDGHLGAGDHFLRAEASVGVTVENAEPGSDLSSFLIYDLIEISEAVARSAGAGDHHAQEHDRSQSQAESALQVSHFGVPPF